MNPEYEETYGLNHCLRLNGLSFIYDPDLDAWTHERRIDGVYRPIVLTGDQIHLLTLDGKVKLTVWEVDEDE
ncbi:hypothetical protein [Microbacterium sp. NPDC091662]|uniref:hypothetical protein n=1 Tax=Microbacterium sp. NPDC091662 TaxID=3364211 RepID=UPI003816EA31